MGRSRFPSPDTLRCFPHSVRYRQFTEVLEALHTIRLILLGHNLNLDSSVFCR